MKWAKLLRRSAAFFLATVAVWALAVTSHAGATAQSLLTFTIPVTKAKGNDLTGSTPWERLLLRQSPFLSAGQVLTGPAASSEPSALPESPESVATPLPTSEPLSVLEDEAPLPSVAPEAQNILAQTLLPTTDGSYPSSDGVFLYNRTNLAVDMDALAHGPVELTGSGDGPRILIIHTHATEAYTQEGQDVYEESDPYRTTDEGHNMLRVGDEMAAAFAQAGLNVLHDRTLHDYPNYNGAYTRSQETVERYLAAYPSISIVLDVHRDALMGEDGTVYKVMADETVAPNCAQVLFVVGTDESGGNHPNWRKNLSLAIALERKLNEDAPTLARPITLRKSNFNQQLSPGSLLVEVGTHGNSLQEAITAARNFAQLAAPVLKELLP